MVRYSCMLSGGRLTMCPLRSVGASRESVPKNLPSTVAWLIFCAADFARLLVSEVCCGRLSGFWRGVSTLLVHREVWRYGCLCAVFICRRGHTWLLAQSWSHRACPHLLTTFEYISHGYHHHDKILGMHMNI